MVQYLRDYFILHAIKVKWIMRVQEKNELFSMSLRPRLSSIKISKELNIAAKKKLQGKLQRIFQGWQKAGFLLLIDGVCHPMPTGLPPTSLNTRDGFCHT